MFLRIFLLLIAVSSVACSATNKGTYKSDNTMSSIEDGSTDDEQRKLFVYQKEMMRQK